MTQSKREQQEYLKNVELARVLDKRAERKRKAGDDAPASVFSELDKKEKVDLPAQERHKKIKRQPETNGEDKQLSSVLGRIF